MKKLLFFTLCFITINISAAQITMDFEGLGDFEYVRDFYNGGLGGNENGPGENFGVYFPGSTNTYLNSYLISGTRGARFSGQATPLTAVSFQQGGAWMNVELGFSDNVSFYYANPNQDSTLYIYSDVNGNGELLDSIFLPRTTYRAEDNTIFPMQYISHDFSGIAKSIDFVSMAHRGYIDDLSLNLTVPLPASIWLLITALVGLLNPRKLLINNSLPNNLSRRGMEL